MTAMTSTNACAADSGLNIMNTARVVSVKELCARTQASRTTLWRWQRDGKIPPPTKLFARRCGWTPEQADQIVFDLFAGKLKSAGAGKNIPKPMPVGTKSPTEIGAVP